MVVNLIKLYSVGHGDLLQKSSQIRKAAFPRRKISAYVLGLLLGGGSFSVWALDAYRDSVLQVIANNPDLYYQYNELLAREQELLEAERRYLPSIDLSYGIGHESTRVTPNTPQDKWVDLTRKESKIKLSENVFDGFRREHKINQNQFRVISSRWKLRSRTAELANQTIAQLIKLRRFQKLIALANTNLNVHKDIYEKVELQVFAGTSDPVTLQQIKGRMVAAEADLLSAENNYQDALDAYIQLTDKMPPSPIVEPDIDAEIWLKSVTQESLIHTALEKNPTLKTAEADVVAARYVYKQAQAPFYPQVNFELDRTWDENLSGVKNPSESWSAMLRMSWNMYNGGRDSAIRDQQAYYVSQSVDQHNRTRREVISSVQLAWNQLKILRRQKLLYDEQLGYLLKSKEVYNQEFLVGKKNLMDLLSVENEVNAAQTKVIETTYDFYTQAYQLAFAQGLIIELLNIQIEDLDSLNSTPGIVRLDPPESRTAPETPYVPQQKAFVPVKNNFSLNGYYLQLASIDDYVRAAEFLEELRQAKVKKLRIINRPVNKVIWQAFQIGPFQRRVEAEALFEDYAKQFKVKPWIRYLELDGLDVEVYSPFGDE